MGSSEKNRRHSDDEEVDFDADTKESTEEVFCAKETVESPHRITCWYNTDTPRKIVKHLPTSTLRCPVGQELKFGRHRTSDVLLNEEHMAREFATVTCRNNQSNNVSFFLRNASRQKRIVFSDVNGRKTEILPTQEIELQEKTRVRLECVEFEITIDLGDTDSKTFELVVRPAKQEGSENIGLLHSGLTAQPGVAQPAPNIQSPHIGLPISSNPIHNQSSPNVRPQFYQGYGNALQTGAGAPFQQMPVVPQYYTGQIPYTNTQAMTYGYPDQPAALFSQPSAMHPSNLAYHPQQPSVNSPPHLLERGGGGYLAPRPSCPYHPELGPHSHGLNMGPLSQTLPKHHESITYTGQGILANPSSHDHRPVLCPSPANPRFKFPEPQLTSHGSQSPDLTDLPRGPPLSRLSSTQSVDLHPAFPANVVTTYPVRETGQSHDMKDPKQKKPVEHEDKPK